MIAEDNFLFEDELEIFEIVDFGFPRRVLQRNNHFEELDELTFFKRFRLLKATTLRVQIEEQLEYPDDR